MPDLVPRHDYESDDDSIPPLIDRDDSDSDSDDDPIGNNIPLPAHTSPDPPSPSPDFLPSSSSAPRRSRRLHGLQPDVASIAAEMIEPGDLFTSVLKSVQHIDHPVLSSPSSKVDFAL